MSLEVAPLIEVGYEISKILGRVHHAVELESHPLLRSQITVPDHLDDGCVCGIVIIQDLMEITRGSPMPSFSDADPAVCRRGSQIDQYAIRPEDTMCLLQGMNHALGGHSSERPGEDHDIELIPRVPEPLGMPNVIVD